ncbi:MAG: prepilin-type N-terminal cleavage/methylation domain-containing protein [Chthoniobacteraceae bacterium]
MVSQIHRRRAGGFTLLEMSLVLFILLLIAGVAIPLTSGLIAEERLRQHARELLLYARTARRLAVTENRPYEIHFAEKAFLLEPYLTSENRQGDVVSNHTLASDTSYSVQRWGEKEFGKPDDESWIFQPSGICEPIRVHFQNDKNWIEFGFNPLTGRAQEETYHFQ